MPVVDTHAHWYPQPFVSLLEREAGENGASVTRNAKGHVVFARAISFSRATPLGC
jgi:hypothetical protein